MNSLDLRIRILLTLQVCLLGMVTRRMYSVAASWSNSDLNVYFVFDKNPSQEEREIVDSIKTELLSHLPEMEVSCAIEEFRSSSSSVRSTKNEVLVFQRAPE